MKSSKVANKYGLFEYEVENYIKKNADFPFKESFFGTITFSDDIDVESFFEPLLSMKKERDEKIVANRVLQEQKQQAKIKEEICQDEIKSPKEYVKTGASYAKDKVNDTLNNEETGMFANVGDKLKKWAKTSFVFGVIIGIVIAIVTIVVDEDMFLAGIGAGIMEIAGAWAFSLILYAFGEMVSNSKENNIIQREILEELRKNK